MFGYKQLIEIAELGLKGDKASLIGLLKKIALGQIKKNKHSSYTAILDLVDKYSDFPQNIALSSNFVGGSIDQDPSQKSDEVWIPDSVRSSLDVFVKFYGKKAFIDQKLNHLNRVLLYGPPGTGKTTLGFQIARALGKEILYVKISDVISSRFGETLKNISDLFARAKEEVIFIDEFDAFAKSRTDSSDVGELKRIVNSLIQTLDFHAQGKTVIVATNLIESIDPAILRRFAFKIHVGYLSEKESADFFEFLVEHEEQFKINLKKSDFKLLNQLLGLKTVDEIRVLFDKMLIAAHVADKRALSVDDFLDIALREHFFKPGRVKSLRRHSPSVVAKLCKRLEAQGMSKSKISDYLGIHRNSYNSYAQKV